MQIKSLELTILIDDEITAEPIEDIIPGVQTFQINNETDTRQHMFFEIDSFGEYIENNMDLTLIYSNGVEFTCIDSYETLKTKINKVLK
jgi:hypothetical protein